MMADPSFHGGEAIIDLEPARRTPWHPERRKLLLDFLGIFRQGGARKPQSAGPAAAEPRAAEPAAVA
ncbi:hypothetical protein ACMHYB_48465 [Sorangium sp. So ce1128]